jgi:hypothetical protein
VARRARRRARHRRRRRRCRRSASRTVSRTSAARSKDDARSSASTTPRSCGDLAGRRAGRGSRRTHDAPRPGRESHAPDTQKSRVSLALAQHSRATTHLRARERTDGARREHKLLKRQLVVDLRTAVREGRGVKEASHGRGGRAHVDTDPAEHHKHTSARAPI